MEQTFTFREAEIPQELVRIAAEEEIRSSQKVVIDESSPKLSTGDTSATVAQQSRSSRSGFKRQSVGARGGKRPVPPLKKRKVLLMKCSHEGQHFEKGFIDESMNMSQISIVMNPPSDSVIWSFCGFPEIDGKICASWVICTVCKSIFSFADGTTSGAKRHIESKHKQILATIKQMGDEEEGQILVADYGDNSIPVRLITENDLLNANTSPRKPRGDDTFDPDSSDQVAQVVFENYDGKQLESATGVRYRSRKPQQHVLQNFKPSSFLSTTCSTCNVDFRNVALAMMHKSCHGLEGRFSCAQCGVILGNVFDFWGHLYSRSCIQ